MDDGAWTIHLNSLRQYTGARNALEVKFTHSVELPAGSKATVKELIDALKQHEKMGAITAMEIKPFDESKLGYMSGGGRMRSAGPRTWQPKIQDPKPPNCTWNPDVSNPDQTLAAAGLCNGAQLQVVEVCRTIG